jgi:hypothetical protein
MKADEFGRFNHLPKAQLAAVVDGLCGYGLVDAADGCTDAGRKTRESGSRPPSPTSWWRRRTTCSTRTNSTS